LSAGKHERGGMTPVISFVFGLIFAYASFGAIAALVGRLLQFSTAIYALLALAMACCGTALLWREPRTECGNGRGAGHHTGAGAAFLLGASFALVVSPCCTPIVLGIIAYTSASGDPLYGSTLLAVFALGHALPVLCVGAGAQRLALILSNGIVKHAVSTTAAALMFALAAYYAVLA
jgi:cytochrome c biogenesis protein CcdA